MKILLQYVVSDPTTLDAGGGVGTAAATAPPGMKVISGGVGNDPRLVVWASRPAGDGSAWVGGAMNPDPVNQANMVAYAICASEDDVEYL